MMDYTFPEIYGNQTQPQEKAPTLSETGAAAFGLENDVVNLFSSMTEPYQIPDLTFNPVTERQKRNLPLEWAEPLARSVSLEDFDRRLAKIQNEEKNRAILASSGWAGTVAAIGAGVLSPTMFIPFAGQARRGMALVEILGLAAAGSATQEAALYYSQETRTEAESFTNIATGTLLGGLLGGAWLGLSKEGRLRLAKDVEVNQRFVDVPNEVSDVGRAERTSVMDEPVYSSELRASLYAPDPYGRDFLASARAIVEEAVPAGKVRVYTSAVPELPVSGATARVAREDVAGLTGAKLHYLDISETDARLTTEDGKLLQDQIALTAEELASVKEVYKGLDPTTGKGKVLQGEMALAKADEVASGGMGALPGKGAIPDLDAKAKGESAGAAVVERMNTSGSMKAPNKARQAAMEAAGKLSPLFRMQNTKLFPSLRDAAYKFDSAGVRQGGLDAMEPSASGGGIVARTQVGDWNIAKYMLKIDSEFYRYIYGTSAENVDVLRSALLQLKSKFGTLPTGKMNFIEFNEAIYDGLSTGELTKGTESAVSAFKEFFAYYNTKHKEYLAELTANGIDASPLYKELTEEEFGKGVTAYAHQIYDQRLINEKAQEFLNDFSKFYNESITESFARDHARMMKRKGDLEFLQRYSGLSAGERAKELADTQAYVEFLDELPELQSYREKRLALTRQARDEGWEAAELKAKQKELLESLPEETANLLDERKNFLKAANSMKKLGGSAEKDIAKYQEQLAKADSLIEDMFRHVMPQIEKADIAIGKVQSSSDKVFAKLETNVKKAFTALVRRTEAYEKVLNSTRTKAASKLRVSEQLAKSKASYENALATLESEGWRKLPLNEQLSGLNLMREDAIRDARALVRNRAAKAADIEEKLDKAQDALPTPESIIEETQKIGKSIDDLEFSFSDKWRARGERSGDPMLGKPDFSEESLNLAMTLKQSLTTHEMVPSFFAVRQSERGPQLMRMLSIPYNLKRKWLVKDTELIARAYDRSMAPDLEIWRAFDGSVNGKSVLDRMAAEAGNLQIVMSQSTHVKLPKGWLDGVDSFIGKVAKGLDGIGAKEDVELSPGNFAGEVKPGYTELTPDLRNKITKYIEAELVAQTRNFDIAIQRVRMTRGVPANADAIMWRTGRLIKNLNVTTMLGSVVPSSIADLARPIFQYGVMKTAKQAWLPFVANLRGNNGKAFRLASREANHRIALNLEPLLHGRARAILDLAEEHSSGKTILERGVNFLAQKSGIVMLFDYWNAGVKVMAGAAVHSTLAEYIPAVADGIFRNAEFSGDLLQMRSHLRDLGLRDLDILRIANEMKNPKGMEQFSNGGALPNFDEWKDASAFHAYGAAVQSMVNKLIVRPGLERPNWMDENLAYSMVGQFSSFTYGANSRQDTFPGQALCHPV